MNKIIEYLKTSNHGKHLGYAFLISLVLSFCSPFLGIGVTGGLGAGMEFKDKCYGNKWDWQDLGCTVLGGLLGSIPSLIFGSIW